MSLEIQVYIHCLCINLHVDLCNITQTKATCTYKMHRKWVLSDCKNYDRANYVEIVSNKECVENVPLWNKIVFFCVIVEKVHKCTSTVWDLMHDDIWKHMYSGTLSIRTFCYNPWTVLLVQNVTKTFAMQCIHVDVRCSIVYMCLYILWYAYVHLWFTWVYFFYACECRMSVVTCCKIFFQIYDKSVWHSSRADNHYNKTPVAWTPKACNFAVHDEFWKSLGRF